jgi:spore maturation protein CgeB
MKFLNVSDATASYPGYLPSLSARVPGYTRLSYADQHSVFEHDRFVWGMPYHRSMTTLGYDILNVDRGIESLQHAWASEHGIPTGGMSADQIVIEQARSFKPDILLYDPSSPALLRKILDDVPSIRLVLGWVGSALTTGRTWGMIDVMMTCAPESVARLTAMGMTSRHVNHSFDPELGDELGAPGTPNAVSFIGSIVRRSEFHLTREQALVAMCDAIPLTIYSPNAVIRPVDYAKVAVAGIAAMGISGLRHTGLLRHLQSSDLVRRAERIASPVRRPVHPKLVDRMKPGVYGLEYFNVLRNSEVSFNIHADTSTEFASNIRLYEATGVGSCLLTDWKSNLADLYDPETEVVAYRSIAEAVEKARWLLDHPRERQSIARAGLRRTLASHTFSHRAQQIDEIIRETLRRG